MHDDQLERRLRATLRDEADRLPLTITAAELERRMVLRRRSSGNRRLNLLLAAAVAIGVLGAGSLIGGLANPPTPSPGPSSVAQATPPAPTATADLGLPSLDDMIAAGAGAIAIAQSHGPADGPDPQLARFDLGRSIVQLGTVAGSTRYAIAYACRGEGSIELDVRLLGGRGMNSGPTVACDGATHEEVAQADGPRMFSLVSSEPASWRIVVRRLDGAAPPPGADQPALQPGEDEESLIDMPTAAVKVIGGPDAAPNHCCRAGTILQDIGAVGGRLAYRLQIRCTDGEAIRYIHGDYIEAAFVARTTTEVPCDGLVHGVSLGIAEPYGSRVFVAAAPESIWSVLVSAEQPPVELVQTQPGFRISGGVGPDYPFDTMGHSLSGMGAEEPGPVMVALACAGTEPIEVAVDLGPPNEVRHKMFEAACTPDGSVTTRTFTADGPDVSASYTSPPRTWTAMSILLPEAVFEQ
jgi:hypothetical protein